MSSRQRMFSPDIHFSIFFPYNGWFSITQCFIISPQITTVPLSFARQQLSFIFPQTSVLTWVASLWKLINWASNYFVTRNIHQILPKWLFLISKPEEIAWWKEIWLDTSYYLEGVIKLGVCWTKCIGLRRDYFEKKTFLL